MLAQMTAEDWLGWQDYFAMYGGLGPEEEWRYRGTVLSFQYNANRAENATALHPEDFYPWLKDIGRPDPGSDRERLREIKKAKHMMWMCKVQAWKERTALKPEDKKEQV